MSARDFAGAGFPACPGMAGKMPAPPKHCPYPTLSSAITICCPACSPAAEIVNRTYLGRQGMASLHFEVIYGFKGLFRGQPGDFHGEQGEVTPLNAPVNGDRALFAVPSWELVPSAATPAWTGSPGNFPPLTGGPRGGLRHPAGAASERRLAHYALFSGRSHGD